MPNENKIRSDSSLRGLVRRGLRRLVGGDAASNTDDLVVRELRHIRSLTEGALTRLDNLERDAAARLKSAHAVDRHVRGLRLLLEGVVSMQKDSRKLNANIVRQVDALVRAQYLTSDVPASLALMAQRFHLRSQNEEDGIVLALLRAAGVSGRRFIEIGSGSSGGNSGVLAHDMGWRGLMVEARSEQAARLRHRLAHNRDVTVIDTMVSSENVNGLIRAHGLAGEVDLLSIDIDSVDYWVFDAVDACTPRVVVLEYNASFGPARAVTLPNAPRPVGAPDVYWGASISALVKLALRKEYDLVLCDDTGTNAFFVRRDLAPAIPRLSIDEAYRAKPFRAGQAAPSPDEVLRAIEEAGLPLIDV